MNTPVDAAGKFGSIRCARRPTRPGAWSPMSRSARPRRRLLTAARHRDR
ncbi:hypothetical protein ACRAWD_29160 [Caulobacter segnis]